VNNPFIHTHSGQKVGPGYESPSVEDIAVSLGRICRFAGHGLRYWPVLLHSMIVADLCPVEYRGLALLHDGAEAMISDIPTPFKSNEMKELEKKLLNSILLQHLTPESYSSFKTKSDDWKIIKLADEEAFLGEVWCVGTKALRDLYPDRCPQAEKLVRKYLRKYKVDDYLNSEGTAIIDFIRRVHSAV
jgi:hypothetical protein